MIRAFGLRDVPAVRQLQQDGTWLDLYHYLIHRRSALTTALIAPVPWWGTGLASYVWQTEQGVQGFVQMLKRPGGQEADVLFIAPGLHRHTEAGAIWDALLAHCISSAAEQGLRRLYGSLPAGSAEVDTLLALGFAIYSNETIWQLDEPAAVPAPMDSALRRQRPDDAWWLRRLYSLYTPPPVQQAEGVGDTEELSSWPMAWWELSHIESYVLQRAGEMAGGVQLASGRRGHWIILHGDTGDSQDMGTLLQQGLHTLGGSRWPVYCAARDYQGGLSAVLQDYGFEPYAQRSRLVKHLALRVKAPELSPVPSLAIRNLS